MNLVCDACGARAAAAPTYPPRCACGTPWSRFEGFTPPVPEHATPLWPDPRDDSLLWKREDLNPTGSFKDRGAHALMAAAAASGARDLVLDSSGSAALAAARAAAVAGLPLRLHVPASLSPGKRRTLDRYGVAVHAGGTRADAAARAAAEAGERFWFSHALHPAFLEGTAAAAAEVLAAGPPPPVWVVPVGNGSLLLGLVRGLAAAGHRGVRLVAVQAAACAGLAGRGLSGDTAAHGIAVEDPPRRDEILAAVAASGGEVVEVDEDAIAGARGELARRGVRAEAAAAAALAGVDRLRAAGESAPVLGWLTGCGSRD